MAATIRARFDDYDAFKTALMGLHDNEVGQYTAYGPTSLDEDEIRELMPEKRSPVRLWATIGAIVGLVSFWLMCILTSLVYDLITGGKPAVSNVPFVVPAYEGTILVGSIFGFFAGLYFARLDIIEPANYDPSFVQTDYGIDVKPSLFKRNQVIDLLKDAGATEINEIEIRKR